VNRLPADPLTVRLTVVPTQAFPRPEPVDCEPSWTDLGLPVRAVRVRRQPTLKRDLLGAALAFLCVLLVVALSTVVVVVVAGGW
jgi:hypothetical protein